MKSRACHALQDDRGFDVTCTDVFCACVRLRAAGDPSLMGFPSRRAELQVRLRFRFVFSILFSYCRVPVLYCKILFYPLPPGFSELYEWSPLRFIITFDTDTDTVCRYPSYVKSLRLALSLSSVQCLVQRRTPVVFRSRSARTQGSAQERGQRGPPRLREAFRQGHGGRFLQLRLLGVL